MFSELVSVGFSHVLCSVISLYSVLLESAKPQGHLLQGAERDDERLKTEACSRLPKPDTHPHGKHAAEKGGWSRWSSSVRSGRSAGHPNHSVADLKASTVPQRLGWEWRPVWDSSGLLDVPILSPVHKKKQLHIMNFIFKRKTEAYKQRLAQVHEPRSQDSTPQPSGLQSRLPAAPWGRRPQRTPSDSH